MNYPALHLSVILILVVSLLTRIEAHDCPAGTYYYQESWFVSGHCTTCYTGYYCPGDNKMYECDTRSIAPKNGMTACISCPPNLPVASFNRSYCVPADAPSNVLMYDMTPANEKPFVVSNTDTFGAYFTFPENAEELVLNVFNVQGSPLMNAYLSTTSGRPSATNYDMMATGRNISIVFKRQAEPILFYLKYDIQSKPQAQLLATYSVISSQVKKQILTNPKFELNMKWTEDYSSYVFFEIPVQATSRVNITVTLNTTNLFYVAIYAATDKYIQYPSQSTYDRMNITRNEFVFTKDTTTSASLVMERVPSGTLYFSTNANVFQMPYHLKLDVKMN